MRQILRALGAALLAAALLPASGCGGTGSDGARPGQLKVVVAFYPFQYAAERVAGSEAKIDNLTQPGAEPHDLELTPRQVASLSDADVVVYQSGFQPAVDKAIEQARPRRLVDVASLVPLRDTDPEAGGDDHTDEPAGHDHAGHDHAGHDHAGHDHGAKDPHAWLDPTTMVTITRALGEELSAARPEQRATFTAHAEAAARDLTALDEEFAAGLRTCQRREFITSHAAFGYLAHRYGLTQVAVRGLSPDQEPSPARIAEVQGLAREHGVTTIFSEELVSPAVSQAIARDLGLRTDVLDPLEGVTDRSRGADYAEVMRSNLQALRTANGCA